MNSKQLILASASPRRAELLRQIGLQFHIKLTDIDETAKPGETPGDYVERLAVEKAQAANSPDAVVIGSDTCVVSPCGEMLGKPQSQADGLRMLQLLAGARHEVLTSVAVVHQQQAQVTVSRNLVTFRPITAAEAIAYWLSGEPLGKAGSYAIQGLGAVFVADLQGSYSGVMGLPLAETAQLLKAQGIDPLATGQ